jgi:aspartokinase-like uncharacterized kinase
VTVAKVGGSLFDLPDLRERLLRWASTVNTDQLLLVPGGGEAADVIRRLDQVHQLGESAAHWLAIRMVQVNAYFLAGLLGVPVVTSVDVRGPARIEVLDILAFCQSDNSAGALEHAWAVTSDSIAARVAGVAGGSLALLKSVDMPPGLTWETAAGAGLVDEAFPKVIAANRVRASWVNLRDAKFDPTG